MKFRWIASTLNHKILLLVLNVTNHNMLEWVFVNVNNRKIYIIICTKWTNKQQKDPFLASKVGQSRHIKDYLLIFISFNWVYLNMCPNCFGSQG